MVLRILVLIKSSCLGPIVSLVKQVFRRAQLVCEAVEVSVILSSLLLRILALDELARSCCQVCVCGCRLQGRLDSILFWIGFLWTE